MNIAILDSSMLQHVSTASVKKHQELNAVEGHMRCITQRMAEFLYSLQQTEKWDYLVIAKDSKPYWRSQYMKEWYKGNTHCIKHDGIVYWSAYNALYVEDDGKLNKVTKKAATVILEEGTKTEFPEGFPFLKYKGNRPAKDYEWLDCAKEDYFDLMARLPIVFTTLMGGAMVEAEGAEADDIAGILAAHAFKNGNKVTLVSGDSDWKQLVSFYPNATYINPFKDERVEGDEDGDVKKKLLVKIIGGDTGDNIRGCASTSKYGPVGEAAAKKVVEAADWGAVDSKYIALNKKLVRLHPDSIPEDVAKRIMESLANPPRTKEMPTWEMLGLTERRRAELDLNSTASNVWSMISDVKEITV